MDTIRDERRMDGIVDPGINIPKLDELNLNDSFNGTGGVERDVGRKPIGPTKSILTNSLKGMASGLRTAFKAELYKSVPAMEPIVNDIQGAYTEFQEVRSNIGAKIRPMVISLEQSARKVLPAAEKIIPKKIYDKAIKTLDEREKIRREEALYTTPEGRAQLKRESEENEVRNALAEIFEAQQDTTRAEALEKKKAELTNMAIESERHKEIGVHFTHLYEAARSTEIFHRTIHTAYLRKSLELKYKHLFVARDTYQLLSGSLKVFESYFKAITKNTSLPEAAKYKILSTDIDNMNRAKVYGEVFSNYLGNVRRHVFTKVKEKLNQAVSGIGALIEQVGSGAELYDSQRAMGEITGERPDASKGIPRLLGWLAGRYGFGGPIKALARYAAPAAKDLDRTLTNFRRGTVLRASNLKKRMMQSDRRFIKWLADFLPGIEGSITSKNDLVTNPEEATAFDKMTRQSIVEIIPGYLSKILQSTESIRQGRDVEQTIYDVYTRKFENRSEFLENARDMMFGAEATRRANFEQIMGTLRTGARRVNPDQDLDALYKGMEKDIHKVFLNHARFGEFVNPDEMREYVNSQGRGIVSPYISKIIMDLEGDPVKVIKAILDGVLNKDGVADKSILSDLQNNVINTMELDVYKTELPKMRETYGYSDILADRINTRQKNLLLDAARSGNKKARAILKEKLGIFGDDKSINMSKIAEGQADIDYEAGMEKAREIDPSTYAEYVQRDMRNIIANANLMDRTGLRKVQRKVVNWLNRNKGVQVVGNLFDEVTGKPVDAPKEFYTGSNKETLSRLEDLLPRLITLCKINLASGTEAVEQFKYLKKVAKNLKASRKFMQKLKDCEEEMLKIIAGHMANERDTLASRLEEEEVKGKKAEARRNKEVDDMYRSLNRRGKRIGTTADWVVDEDGVISPGETLERSEAEYEAGGNNLGAFLNAYSRNHAELIGSLTGLAEQLHTDSTSIFDVVARIEGNLKGEKVDEWTKDQARVPETEGKVRQLTIEEERLRHPIEFAMLEEIRGMRHDLSIIAKSYMGKAGDDDRDGDVDGTYEDQMNRGSGAGVAGTVGGIAAGLGGSSSGENDDFINGIRRAMSKLGGNKGAAEGTRGKTSGIAGINDEGRSAGGKSGNGESSGFWSTIAGWLGIGAGSKLAKGTIKKTGASIVKRLPKSAQTKIRAVSKGTSAAAKKIKTIKSSTTKTVKKVGKQVAKGQFKQAGKTISKAASNVGKALRNPFKYVSNKVASVSRAATKAYNRALKTVDIAGKSQPLVKTGGRFVRVNGKIQRVATRFGKAPSAMRKATAAGSKGGKALGTIGKTVKSATDALKATRLGRAVTGAKNVASGIIHSKPVTSATNAIAKSKLGKAIAKKTKGAKKLLKGKDPGIKIAKATVKKVSTISDAIAKSKLGRAVSSSTKSVKNYVVESKAGKAVAKQARRVADSKVGQTVAKGTKTVKTAIAKSAVGQKISKTLSKIMPKSSKAVAKGASKGVSKAGAKVAAATAAKTGGKFAKFLGKIAPAAKFAGKVAPVIDLLFAGAEAEEGRKNAESILGRDWSNTTDEMRDTVASQKAVNSLGLGIGDYINSKLYGDENAHAKALVDIDEMTGTGKLPNLTTNFTAKVADYGWYNPIKWAAWVADGATGVTDWTLKAPIRAVAGIDNAISAKIEAINTGFEVRRREKALNMSREDLKANFYPKIEMALKGTGLEGTPVTGKNGVGLSSTVMKAISKARSAFGNERWDAVINEAVKKDPQVKWVDIPELYNFFTKWVRENYLTDAELERKGDEASLAELNARKLATGNVKGAIDALRDEGIKVFNETKSLDAAIVAVNKAFSKSKVIAMIDKKDRKYVQAEAIKSLQDYAKDPQGFAEREAARDTERKAKAAKDTAALEGQTAEIQAKLDATAPAAATPLPVKTDVGQPPAPVTADATEPSVNKTIDDFIAENGEEACKNMTAFEFVSKLVSYGREVAKTYKNFSVTRRKGFESKLKAAGNVRYAKLHGVTGNFSTQMGDLTDPKTGEPVKQTDTSAVAPAKDTVAATIVAADNQSAGGKTAPMPSKEPPAAEEGGKINYENTSSVIKAFIKAKGGEAEVKKLTADQFKRELIKWYRDEYDKYKKANRNTPGFKALSATRFKGMVTKLEVAGADYYAKMYGISGRYAISHGELIDPKTGKPVDRTATTAKPSGSDVLLNSDGDPVPAKTLKYYGRDKLLKEPWLRDVDFPGDPDEEENARDAYEMQQQAKQLKDAGVKEGTFVGGKLVTPTQPTPVTAPEVAETIKEAGEGAAAKTVPTPTKSGNPKTGKPVDRTESRIRQKARKRRQEALAKHEAMMRFYADEVQEERTVDADGTVHVRKSTGERRVIGGDFVGKGMFTEHQYNLIKALYSDEDKAQLIKDVPAAADMFKLAAEGKFREPVEGEQSYKAVQAKKAKAEGIPEEAKVTEDDWKDFDEWESHDGDSVGVAADLLKKPTVTSMADLVNRDVARKPAGGTSRGSSRYVADLVKGETSKEDAGISSPSTRNLLERPKPVTANAEESATVVAAKATVKGAEKVEAAVGPTIEALKKQQEEQQKQWQSVVDQNNKLLKLLTGAIDPANGFKVAGMSELTEVCGTTKPVVIPTPGPTQVVPVPTSDKEEGLDLRKKQW